MVETVVTVERTTTTTTGPPGGVNPAPNGGGFWSAIRLNLDYFRTIPGILKIVQLVSTLSLYIQYIYTHTYIHILPRTYGMEAPCAARTLRIRRVGRLLIAHTRVRCV